MKQIHKYLLSLVSIAFILPGCEQVNQIIDDLFTFNYTKSVDTPLPAATPVGIYLEAPLPIPIDSASLAQNNTNLDKVKSCKLTNLVVTFSDPAYTINNFDSLTLTARADGMSDAMLATWSGSEEKWTLSNVDFAPYVKGTNPTFITGAKVKTTPATDLIQTNTFTITFTAAPLN